MRFLSLILALLLSSRASAQEPEESLTQEEEKYLDEFLEYEGPWPCPPSIREWIKRCGLGVIPHVTRRMEEGGKSSPLCAQLLFGVTIMGSLPAPTQRALIDVLKKGGKGSTSAAAALGSTCCEEARFELEKASASENPHLVKASVHALTLLGGRSARDRLFGVRATWEGRDDRYGKEVLTAVTQGLELLAASESEDRKAMLMELIRRPASWDGLEWAYSSDRAALRKINQLNLKDLVPDLRALADKRAQDKNLAYLVPPMLFAIHKLGGSVSEEELRMLRRLSYLPPLKKAGWGYITD